MKPQLAKPLVSPKAARKGVTFDTALAEFGECVAEYKFDGHRRLASRSLAWSRSLAEYNHGFQRAIPPGVTLDGELVAFANPLGCTSSEVNALLAEEQKFLISGGTIPHGDTRSLGTGDSGAPFPDLAYKIFDIVEFEGESLVDFDWSERREILESLAPQLLADSLGAISISEVCRDPHAMLDRAASLGCEGIMLKTLDGPYQPNGRAEWRKHKFVADFDVVVTGMGGGSSVSGHVGLEYGFTCAATREVRTVGTLGHTGTPEALAPLVGTVAKVKSFGDQFPSGALRHPQVLEFRSDKGAAECVFRFA